MFMGHDTIMYDAYFIQQCIIEIISRVTPMKIHQLRRALFEIFSNC